MSDATEDPQGQRERLQGLVAPMMKSVSRDQIEAAAEPSPRGPLTFPPGLVHARPAGGVPGLVATFTASDDLHDPQWELEGVVALQGTELVVAELTLRSHPSASQVPAGGVKRPVLSAISIPALLRGVRRSLAEHARLVAIDHGRGALSGSYRQHAELVAAAAAQIGAVPMPGRKGHDETLYHHLAARYLEIQDELQAQGLTARGIVPRLALDPWEVDTRRGLSKLPKDTVKSRLKKCVELGFLTFEGGGRAGAIPGPRYFENPTNAEEEQK